MKVDLDARTLEAMRRMCRITVVHEELLAAQDTLRAFLAAHDSARDAERDEALARVLYECNNYKVAWAHANEYAHRFYIKQARAARDFIAKEQGQ